MNPQKFIRQFFSRLQDSSQLFWPVLTGILAGLLLIVILTPNLVVLSNTIVNRSLFSEHLQKNTAPKNIEQLNNISFADAVNRSAPAVVNIYTRKTVIQHSHPLFNDPIARKLFGLTESPQEKVLTGLGSGVIMNSEGYILTNQHVIAGADEVLVELTDKRQSRAEIVGSDLETDLAVLKINLEYLPSISTQKTDIAVGDIALAIGNPLGIGQTVTMGIISAIGRSNLGLSTYENFIQTDAAINRGNSGGALVNVHGELIGINSAIFSKTSGVDGISFAIPVSLAVEVMQSIISNGKVVRGWLGANFQQLTPELANYLATQKNHGVVITRLLKDGPAHQAGVMIGDLVLEINNEAIQTEQDALTSIARIQPGNNAELLLIRKNQEITLNVTLGERPSQI